MGRKSRLKRQRQSGGGCGSTNGGTGAKQSSRGRNTAKPMSTAWLSQHDETAFAVLLFLFFFLTPLIFISGFTPSGTVLYTLYDQPKFVFIGAAALILLFLFTLSLAWNESRRSACIHLLRHGIGPRLLAVLFVLQAISLIGAQSWRNGVLQLSIYAIFMQLYVALTVFFRRRRLLAAALHGTVLSLAVFCPIGIMQFFGIDMPFLVPIFGPASTMGYRNPAAHYLVCNIPFAFLLAWHYLRPAEAADKCTPAALLFGTLGIMALVHVFMTATRTAILALMVYTLALPFMLLFGSGRKPNARLLLRTTASVILAIAVLGGLLMAFPQTRQRAMHTIRNAGSLSMLEARRFHWGNTLYMIRDQPLSGVGLGNWQFNYPRYSHRYMRDTCFNLSTQVQRVHNDYLQLTAECGIPALLVFLVLWGRQFVRAWNSDDVFDHRLRYALICSMIAFSVIMLLSFPLQMGYSRMFFFFLLANGGGRL